MSSEFIPKEIERIRCNTFNHWTDASKYLYHILNVGVDWIINLDEDAFVTDWNSILDIINFMRLNEYDYAGMPDGGVSPHRSNSWIACNPFFNIFNAKAIRMKMPDIKIIDAFQYDPKTEKYKPNFLRDAYNNEYFEPYNNLFYWLITCNRCLFLDADTHADTISTLLKWNDKRFVYHSWYAREFNSDIKEKERITNLYNEAKDAIKN